MKENIHVLVDRFPILQEFMLAKQGLLRNRNNKLQPFFPVIEINK